MTSGRITPDDVLDAHYALEATSTMPLLELLGIEGLFEIGFSCLRHGPLTMLWIYRLVAGDRVRCPSCALSGEIRNCDVLSVSPVGTSGQL